MSRPVKSWKEYRAEGNSTEAAMLMEIAELRARLEAAPPVVLERQAVASVVSRVGDVLRVGWLRPERCDVGTLLYSPAPPSARSPVLERQLERLRTHGPEIAWEFMPGWAPEMQAAMDAAKLKKEE